MNNCFPLDFIRQIIEQTLLEQHHKNPTKFFGGKNQVNLFSFYEQLQKEDEVDRYVQIYRDLTEQQNRTGLLMNGTIIAPENPTITNLYLDTIIPMTFTCSFRVRLADRDMAITTINNLIEILKGRKQDVALFENGEIFKVGTIANDSNVMFPTLKNGDYIGTQAPVGQTINVFCTSKIASFTALGVADQTTYPQWYYYSYALDDNMYVAYKFNASSEWETIPKTLIDEHGEPYVEPKSNYPDILFPPQGTFEKYKVSMSFDSLRCDEPRNLNADEYCVISFGGSATLVNNGVALGNDLVKLGIAKSKIVASPNIVIHETSDLLTNSTWLEPLEMPSGNSANSITNLLNSNRFNTNSHTTNITIANQYSFVIDRSIPLLDQLYKYARWGYFGVDTSGETPNYTYAITPNMIFRVFEINSSWGDIEINFIDAKIVEDISIENTESDTLSMTLTFQKQGGSDIGGSGGSGGSGETTEYVSVDTDQTITGKKTFTNQVVMTNTISNGTYVYTLPSESGQLATHEWVQSYTGNLNNYVKTSGNQTIGGNKHFTGDMSVANISMLQTLLPDGDDDYYIGSEDNPWAGIYADKILFDYGEYSLYQDNGILYFENIVGGTGSQAIATRSWVSSNFGASTKCRHNISMQETNIPIYFEFSFISGSTTQITTFANLVSNDSLIVNSSIYVSEDEEGAEGCGIITNADSTEIRIFFINELGHIFTYTITSANSTFTDTPINI